VPGLVETGFVNGIDVIQIGMHNYGGGALGQRVIQLCEMHALLSKTHRLVKGVPFGWERWVKR
jgi:hypothetical protein